MPKYNLTVADQVRINILHEQIVHAKKLFSFFKDEVKNGSYHEITRDVSTLNENSDDLRKRLCKISNVNTPDVEALLNLERINLDKRVLRRMLVIFNQISRQAHLDYVAWTKQQLFTIHPKASPFVYNNKEKIVLGADGKTAVRQEANALTFDFSACEIDLILDSLIAVLEEYKQEKTISRDSSLFLLLRASKIENVMTDLDLTNIFYLKSSVVDDLKKYTVNDLETAYLSHASFFTSQGKMFKGELQRVVQALKEHAANHPKGASAETLRDFGINK